MLIGLAGTIGTFSFLIVTAVAIAWTVRQVALARTEAMKLAIERGQPFQWEVPNGPERDTRRGVLAISLGLGLAIAFGVLFGAEVAVLGAIPTLLGLGWLLSAFLARRSTKQRSAPPPPGGSGLDSGEVIVTPARPAAI